LIHIFHTIPPISERFVITNHGPLAVKDVHYTCAVTAIVASRAEADTKANSFIMVMIPVTPHIPVINWKETTSTDCDFIARFGSELVSLRVDITVFFRRWTSLSELHKSARFSAKRDTAGKFIWDYGSPDRGPFDDDRFDPLRMRPVVFAPFWVKTSDIKITPEVVEGDIAALISAAGVKKRIRQKKSWVDSGSGSLPSE
jgi:hypothetical protein